MENTVRAEPSDEVQVPGPSTYSPVDCFEALQTQQEEIEKTIKESGPLVSELLPLSTLAEDFNEHTVYLEKLELLKKRYGKMRRSRRDGNCFYRAFGFAYMEYLMQGKRKEEAKRFIRFCDECKEFLISVGYTEFTVEDFHEQFTGMVEKLVLQDGSLSELEDLFNNQSYSDYYVVFLRLSVSSYMQRNESFYSNFIPDNKTVRRFCETEVEPMGLECDNIHVAALALAMDVPIKIENCQQSGELNCLEFPGRENASSGEHAAAPVVLLYRPGHYDILYA
ncbi:Ubiquitin thioesterase otubain protein [Echinococcus multilocularis]|uniref:Ubiquitin thioesterase n=1 Tax=Echinococcus multilocularis TaxID=6211 RepID=A0A068Y7E9_ECHMU|nr:Ubiquitin thioesterase otubain protein [Echinococcus multilocularis]